MGGPPVRVSDVRFAQADAPDVGRGLLGWVRCRYGSLELDGLAVRKALDGRLLITFPSKRDRAGRRHTVVRALDDASHRELEAQILRALGEAGRLP